MSALHAHRFGGDGPPAVLLHGFLGTGADWAAAPEHLGRPVLAPDLPGHAFPCPLGTLAYSFGGWPDALARTLDAHGLDRVPLLGYSMGGRLALAFAARHPARVALLVLSGASAGLEDPAARAERVALDEQRARAIEVDLPAFLGAWYRMPLFATLPDDVRERLVRERTKRDPSGLARALRGLGTGRMPPLWDALAGLPFPVVAVAGARDARFSALAARLAATAPRGRAVTVPDAGHAPHLERPDAFWAAVRPFLSSSPQPVPSHG